MCMYINILGSSRYVKFMSFWKFLLVKMRKFLHSRGRSQVYIFSGSKLIISRL